jgi:hypothetical protein
VGQRTSQLKARVIDGTKVRSKTYTVGSRDNRQTKTDVKPDVNDPTKPVATKQPPTPPPSASAAPPSPEPKRGGVVPTPSTAKLLAKRNRPPKGP